MDNRELSGIYMAIMNVDINVKRYKTVNVFARSNYGAGHIFDYVCENIQRAHDNGFTVIRKVQRGADGKIAEIIFDQVLTPTGQALLEAGAPDTSLSADTKAFLRKRLEESAVTGKSNSPAINGRGETVGNIDDFMSREQIRANAKRQLDILDELDRKTTG